MTSSLIISTYNRPDALDVVLRSAVGQTVIPDEVIIADDGSGKETIELVTEWIESQRLPVEIRHVWQEDDGFRLAKIRNKAIAAAKGDYIIQVDGDAFLHPRFVEDHLKAARRGTFIKGSRVMLDAALTERICSTRRLSIPSVFSLHIEQYRDKALRWGFLRDRFEYFNPKDLSALGCNMAFWRDDAIAVNGYDEEFKGWGHEDTDFTMRLHRNGVRKRNLRYAALIYHLWHPQAGDGARNAVLRDEQERRGNARARLGIDQYLDETKG